MGAERDIVLVDDEPEILEELGEYLRMRGYQCDIARSGQEFFSLWERRGPYRLVITDIRMPDMDGLDLLRRLRGRGFDTPVLVVTGHASDEEAEKARESGACRVMQKPLDLKGLRQAIADIGVLPQG